MIHKLSPNQHFTCIFQNIRKNRGKKLLVFLESYNTLYLHQYGFRPGHNTIHPIIQLLKQVSEENDKPAKNFTMSVFLYLSKAFDTISHDILITKLEHLGIQGLANDWFKSYLTERKQYLEIRDEKNPLWKLLNVACRRAPY